MAYQAIGIGSSANDGTGDTLRVGADKVNDNFVEIYTALGAGSTTALRIVTSGASANDALIFNSSNNRFEPSPIVASTFSTLTNEGDTDDSFETSISVVDPTADRTINFPDASGTVITTGNLGDITTSGTFTSNITFEGSTADSFETTLAVTDPTADRTITLPNLTGTVSLITATETLTNKTLTTPIITEIDGSTITLDSAGDITLDADGADVILKDGGTEFGRFTNNSGELQIKSGSSSTTNLTMSGANTTIAGNLTVTGNATANGSTITLGDAAGDTIAFGGTITGNLVFEGSTADSFETTMAPGNPSADITLTLPSSGSDTLVGKATTDTLTNKTLTSPKINENVVMSSTATELNLLDGATVTTTELNIMDGDTTATSTTLADADRLVTNDAGTMKQVALTDVKTYLSSAGFSSEDPTALAIALG